MQENQYYPKFSNEKKVYEEPNEINEKIKEIDEKLQVAKKQNNQRLCLPFTYEEMKQLRIAYEYKYDFNQKSKIIEHIKENVMKEVEAILKEMKENFFKGIDNE